MDWFHFGTHTVEYQTLNRYSEHHPWPLRNATEISWTSFYLFPASADIYCPSSGHDLLEAFIKRKQKCRGFDGNYELSTYMKIIICPKICPRDFNRHRRWHNVERTQVWELVRVHPPSLPHPPFPTGYLWRTLAWQCWVRNKGFGKALSNAPGTPPITPNAGYCFH